MFGIAHLSLNPVRKEPNDRSEMVTQLLFGDAFQVLERTERWVQVRLSCDGYEGWIGSKQFQFVSEKTFDWINDQPKVFTDNLVSIVENQNKGDVIPVVFGSSLPFWDGKSFHIENDTYQYDGIVFQPDANLRKSLVAAALSYLNAPYLWGGKSPFGIDCSGLVQMVYKIHGTFLMRDASQQADQGITLSFVEEAEPGDLAFFDNEEGHIIHVGMVLPEQQIIHASGKVRIDRLDHQGIYNEEIRGYSHQLRLLKRVL
jgi:hypothetical protein